MYDEDEYPPGAPEGLTPTQRMAGILRYLAFRRAAGSSDDLRALTVDYAGVSGDRMLRRDLRELRDRGLPAECLPAATHVQRVAALIQRPWDDVCVVDARAFGKAVNVCRARPAVGVLTAPEAGPAELAAALTGWRRTLVVLEDVGGQAEELSIVDPA